MKVTAIPIMVDTLGSVLKGKETGRIGNQSKKHDHADHSIFKIGYNTQKNSGDLRWETQPLKTFMKNSHRVKTMRVGRKFHWLKKFWDRKMTVKTNETQTLGLTPKNLKRNWMNKTLEEELKPSRHCIGKISQDTVKSSGKLRRRAVIKKTTY